MPVHVSSHLILIKNVKILSMTFPFRLHVTIMDEVIGADE